MRWKLVTRMTPLVAVGLMLMSSTAAFGQTSGVAGQVTDNTGGVLPGVTVEAASPVLTEGSRVAVTDGQGRYSIVGMRPGIYTVTYSLAGFSTVIREEIDLPSAFTATIDVELAVGTLEETVTVSGQSPVVDVQQAGRVQVLSRDVLDNIINTGSPWTQAMLVPGVAVGGPDVGGSRFVNDLQVEARGADSQHTTVMQDGMSLDLGAFDGVAVQYNQDLAAQEVAVTAGGGGGNAEMQAGGVVLNIIPKEGGNTFSGQGYAGYTPGGWISDNLTQRLQDLGVGTIGEFDQIYDYSGSIGGPLIRDRLWFHESFRWWGAWTPVPDRLFNDGSVFINEEDIISNVIRLTAQATPSNKFTVFLDRLDKRRGPVLDAIYPAVLLPGQRGPDPETAINYQNKGQGWNHAPYWQGQAKWTSTVSNRLLVEAGYTSVGVADCCSDPMPGSQFGRNTPEWFQFARKTDLDLGVQWDSVEDFSWNLPAQRYMGAVSYVTGSHNFKTGFSQGWGREEQHRFGNADLQHIQYRSGVPDSVSIRNYPWIRKNNLDHDIGWYAQDAWTLDRLTVTAGIRADWLKASVPAQQVMAGRFIGERNFAPVEDVPNWGPDWAPRFGIAYDLFGDATTAIKFSVGKYLLPLTTSLSTRVNPMALLSEELPWDDADIRGMSLATNGDNIAQDNELDLTRLPSDFGQRRLDTIDPDLKREHNVETSISVERELMPGVSLSGGWYHRSFYNPQLIYNRERTASDYRPIGVVSPLNGESFTVYDLKSASELSLVDNLVTNVVDHRRVYNGFEVALNARLPGGGTMITSDTFQRARTDECDVRDDPNELRFCDRFDLPSAYPSVDFKHDFKFGAYFPLPWDMQVSAVINSVVGRPTNDVQQVDKYLPVNWSISRNTRYTEENCAGQPCTAGDLVIPDMVLSSLSVPLAPEGTVRHLPRLTLVNFSFQKILQAAGLELRPQLEIYNLTNEDTWYSERSANFGTATYGVPGQIVLGRMLRLSVQLQW